MCGFLQGGWSYWIMMFSLRSVSWVCLFLDGCTTGFICGNGGMAFFLWLFAQVQDFSAGFKWKGWGVAFLRQGEGSVCVLIVWAILRRLSCGAWYKLGVSYFLALLSFWPKDVSHHFSVALDLNSCPLLASRRLYSTHHQLPSDPFQVCTWASLLPAHEFPQQICTTLIRLHFSLFPGLQIHIVLICHRLSVLPWL